MFQISANDIPIVRTRRALLAIDTQNDFLGQNCPLPVRNPPGFVDNIVELIRQFRPAGDVIYVRSVYETSRRVNEPHADSEKVITDKDVKARRAREERRKRSRSTPATNDPTEHKKQKVEVESTEDEIDDRPETFLTASPDGHPLMQNNIMENVIGSNIPLHMMAHMNYEKDLFCEKSYYSAFKDGALVQTLRGRFVTEIFLCGVLSNISVYATAMDAARHGYAITIIDDCLGYRSKARHDEALLQLQQYTGCVVMSSGELIADMQDREEEEARRDQKATIQKHADPPRDDQTELENLMGSMKLGESSNASAAAGKKASNKHSAIGSRNKAAEAGAGKERVRVKSKIRTRRRPSVSISQSKSPDGSPPQASAVSSTLANDPNSASSPKVDLDSVAAQLQTSLAEVSRFISEMGTLSRTPVQMDAAASIGGEANLCEGDAQVTRNLLPEELALDVFEKIRDEVLWQSMSHRGSEVPRLVSVQGQITDNGSMPLYRHPSDESPPLSPFSPTVSIIKGYVEKQLGHSVNHVLIQFYRNGLDNISEHSDKTLDIVPDTFIANVSLGAQRTMVFRTKKLPDTERRTQKALLPHNSLCRLGPTTNMKWLHGIRPEKRFPHERSAEELAFNGERISLTFRSIGTFINKSQTKIWGQGATGKREEDARRPINGETPETEAMIRAFGKENHASEFDREAVYGKGFDVLNTFDGVKVFMGHDNVENERVKLLLAHYDVAWIEGYPPPSKWKQVNAASQMSHLGEEPLPIRFMDKDESKSIIEGSIAIMLYIDQVYGIKTPVSNAHLARQYTCLMGVEKLLQLWRAQPFIHGPFRAELAKWNKHTEFPTTENSSQSAHADAGPYLAGSEISLADIALFPVLKDIGREWKNPTGFFALTAYVLRVDVHPSVVKAGVHVKDDQTHAILASQFVLAGDTIRLGPSDPDPS